MMNNLVTVGAVSEVSFPELDTNDVPARIDTGAKTSAVWASSVILENDRLSFCLFDKISPLYNGKVIKTSDYKIKKIRSTNGISERRYAVKLTVLINGRRIKASFTLANREKQVYPVLIGRNVLRGKFMVNIKHPSSPKQLSQKKEISQ